MGKTFSWQCPFCNHHATIGDDNHQHWWKAFGMENRHGRRAVSFIVIVCPNHECREYTLEASMHLTDFIGGEQRLGKLLTEWMLIPAGAAKVLPQYVPTPIVADYGEACQIRDLSPKAAATLARRALQGMIRDYWGIKKGRLKDEIDALEDKVDPTTWTAIDAVRSVGNIGAHMEKDINLVVEVDPGEAQLLIELIETLVEDWYVARHNRDERLRKVRELAEAKERERRGELPGTDAAS